MTENVVQMKITNFEITPTDAPELSEEAEKAVAALSRYWDETWDEWAKRAMGLSYGQALQIVVDRDKPTCGIVNLLARS
ncbi:hypothetical protein LJR231_001560 [Phyllobacterium sp. LjRoot231]|uniref:hypothetical protein n=1 Tax=Phyllobacterium sp. LjRoot231 TaxID=3342289 RepID=UPI003ECEB08B